MTHILPPTGAPLPLPPLRHEILSSDEDGFKKFLTAILSLFMSCQCLCHDPPNLANFSLFLSFVVVQFF